MIKRERKCYESFFRKSEKVKKRLTRIEAETFELYMIKLGERS